MRGVKNFLPSGLVYVFFHSWILCYSTRVLWYRVLQFLSAKIFMKLLKNKWFWILIVILAGGSWWFFGRTTQVVYETETAKRGDIREIVSVSGVLEPDNSTEVSFETSGTLNVVYVQKGDRVEKGDMLAKIDDGVLQAQRREAILSVETAVQSEWLARRTWDTLKPEQKEMKKLASESARASLATLNKTLQKTVLRAPVSGTVTQVYADAGEVTTMASPVIQIVTGDGGAHIEADVPESDVSKLALGQTASVTFDALTKKDIFSATVNFIDPRAKVVQDVVYYPTKFILGGFDDRFKTGMSANVDVETAKKINVLLLTRRAVQEDANGSYVDILQNNTKVRRDVETGLKDDEGNVEILKGLSEGEVVVVGA